MGMFWSNFVNVMMNTFLNDDNGFRYVSVTRWTYIFIATLLDCHIKQREHIIAWTLEGSLDFLCKFSAKICQKIFTTTLSWSATRPLGAAIEHPRVEHQHQQGSKIQIFWQFHLKFSRMAFYLGVNWDAMQPRPACWSWHNVQVSMLQLHLGKGRLIV